MSFLANASFGFGTNGSASGVVVGAANNGTSLNATTVVLGQNVGQSGNPAVLLSNREIPMGGFSILLSGNGNLVVGSATDGGQKFQIVGTTNSVQQLITLPSTQTVSNAIFQINTSLGVPIFALNSNGPHNTFIGIGSGIVCGTPSGAFGASNNNTAVGWMAMNAITTGNANTAIGEECMVVATSGGLNTGVGARSLFSLTTGINNVGIGQAALAFYTTGSSNIGIGMNALRGGSAAGAAGSDNIALGSNCMGFNPVASQNVAMGTSALASVTSNSSVSQCIAIGYTTCRAGVIGIQNVVIGWASHAANDLGASNILIGANQSATIAITNTTMIGTSMVSQISNVVGLGLSTQNIILGVSTLATDNGARLQVSGNQSLGVVTSGAGTLILDATATHYVFTGTTTTWTLPAVTGHTGWYYLLKNRGSGAITLNSSGGGNDIYNTSAVSTFTINAGEAFILTDDGTFWLVE